MDLIYFSPPFFGEFWTSRLNVLSNMSILRGFINNNNNNN